MAQITDLTWAQLETAAGLTNLIVSDSTNGLMIRVAALTGITTTSKAAMGVTEVLFELRNHAAKAQETVNSGQNIGERLAAFPPISSGTAINGYVTQAGQIIVKTPLSTSGIVGANN